MEIVRPQSRRNFLSSSNDAVSVPTIPLYRSAPSLEVRLEEFESFAIDRLRGLFSSSPCFYGLRILPNWEIWFKFPLCSCLGFWLSTLFITLSAAQYMHMIIDLKNEYIVEVDIRNLQAICVFFKYVELLSESWVCLLFHFRCGGHFASFVVLFWLIVFLVAVLKGISDGMSRGKKPEEMENLVNKCIFQFWFVGLSLMLDQKKIMLCGGLFPCAPPLVQVKDLWKVNMRHQHASDVLNKDIVSHFVLRLVYCRT